MYFLIAAGMFAHAAGEGTSLSQWQAIDQDTILVADVVRDEVLALDRRAGAVVDRVVLHEQIIRIQPVPGDSVWYLTGLDQLFVISPDLTTRNQGSRIRGIYGIINNRNSYALIPFARPGSFFLAGLDPHVVPLELGKRQVVVPLEENVPRLGASLFAYGFDAHSNLIALDVLGQSIWFVPKSVDPDRAWDWQLAYTIADHIDPYAVGLATSGDNIFLVTAAHKDFSKQIPSQLIWYAFRDGKLFGQSVYNDPLLEITFDINNGIVARDNDVYVISRDLEQGDKVLHFALNSRKQLLIPDVFYQSDKRFFTTLSFGRL
jgi:hypothetical protein